MKELINIENNEGILLVSSREVAENFGKRPSEVNRTIENLTVENCTVKNMIIESSYISSRGREEKEYLLTRDGFSLLVMGFTGKKALEWKLKYIEAFNNMEKYIKSNLDIKPLNTPQAEAKADIELMETVSKYLGLNNNSKLLITHRVFNKRGLPLEYLPKYTNSKGQLLSATELLKRYDVGINAITFNKIMIKLGYITELERPSKSKGVKKFKSLVNTTYGENQVSPHNHLETQILYYEDKFKDLVTDIGLL